MRTPEVEEALIEVYASEKLSVRELYVRFRSTGITWQEVRDLLRSKGLMRKQGTTERGRTYSPIKCHGCPNTFIPLSSSSLHCDACRPQLRLNNILKNGYDITREEYEALLELQNYVCAICQTPFNQLWEKSKKDGLMRRTTRIDHDHKTNRVRGLLCNRCNVNLRGLEDEEWMRKALTYLGR